MSLEQQCLDAFDKWWATARVETRPTDPLFLARDAFIAGFRDGGIAGADMMHKEALRVFG